jgi:Peptidase family M28
MAASQPPVRRRRRPRRGSLERPVNGRLYRGSFALVLPWLLLLLFTVTRPAPLARPALPGSFDSTAALEATRELANDYPDRAPGTAGASGAAGWLVQQLQPYGLRTSASSWYERIPGLGRVRLENLVAVVPGQSPETIVVMAHRDDLGSGPGANDDASGTGALVELARAYAQPQTGSEARVQSAFRIAFVSTDAGAFGGLGAVHFLATSRFRGHILAVVDLDALAGRGTPEIEIAGDRPRSPNPTLVATAVARIGEQTGRPPRHMSVIGQLIDLGFPYTLYEQGPFVGAGVPAVTVTTGGDRPPTAFGDSASALQPGRLAQLGRAAQELLGSLDQGLTLPPSTPSYVWLGGRVVHGWAIELVLVSLLLPFAIALVDVYALCRRHRVPVAPAARALRSRLCFWLFAGLVFTCFRLFGAWPAGPSRPPNPATPVAGDWPAVALLALLAVLLAGWLFERQRLVVRRRVTAEEQLAGLTVGLVGTLLPALLVAATNPFALLFVLPALHVWLWLPQARIARAPVRLAIFVLGLAGPAIVLGSLAWRFGLGLDAPWYLLELVGVGYIGPWAFAIALAGTAAAAQLAAVAAGRYAPYPDRRERGPRGPFRELVRTLVLGSRARRAPRVEDAYSAR